MAGIENFNREGQCCASTTWSDCECECHFDDWSEDYEEELECMEDRVRAAKVQSENENTDMTLPLATPAEMWACTEAAVAELLKQNPHFLPSATSEEDEDDDEWDDLSNEIGELRAEGGAVGGADLIGAEIDEELDAVTRSPGYQAWLDEKCDVVSAEGGLDLSEIMEKSKEICLSRFPTSSMSEEQKEWLAARKEKLSSEQQRINRLLESASRDSDDEEIDTTEYALSKDWTQDEGCSLTDDNTWGCLNVSEIRFQKETYDDDIDYIDLDMAARSPIWGSSAEWDFWFTALRDEYKPRRRLANEVARDFMCSGNDTFVPLCVEVEESDEEDGFGFGVVPYGAEGGYMIDQSPGSLVMTDYDNGLEEDIYRSGPVTDMSTNFDSESEDEVSRSLSYYDNAEAASKKRLACLDLAGSHYGQSSPEMRNSCPDLMAVEK